MKPFLLAALAAFLLAAPSASFAQSSGALSFGKPKAAESTELVTVQAKGQGETVEAAKKDAARNAIKKAVGELVDARTLVENDELVEDRILTLSNAMIEKADYGKAMNIGDGLFEVPVTAVVKKGRLNKELEKIGIATGTVSGSSLAASLFSGRERVANAEKFFAERLKDFPGNVVEAVMLAKDNGTPDIEIDTEKGHVYANVGLRVNMANYAEWTKQLQEVLGAVCLEQEQTNLKFGDIQWADTYLRKFVGSKVANLHNVLKSAMVVVMATPTAEKVRRSTWPATVYYLDAQMAKAFAKQMAAQIPEKGVLEVILEDEDGEPVCSTTAGLTTQKDADPDMDRQYATFCIGQPHGYDGLGYKFASIPVMAYYRNGDANNHVFMAPALDLGYFDSTRDFMRHKDLTAKFRIDLGEVSEDDLEAVTGFQVKVEYAKPQADED